MFLFAPWQELKKLGLGSEVDLHVSEVPVEYQTVQSLVPSLWKQYRPLVRGECGVKYPNDYFLEGVQKLVHRYIERN